MIHLCAAVYATSSSSTFNLYIHQRRRALTLGAPVEYRVWNPFRSKLAAAMMGGLDNVPIKPGSKLLYLGAASGTTVSHCSDMVGPVSIVRFYFGYL